MTVVEDTHRRSRLRITLWVGLALGALVIAAWIALAKNPSLYQAGMSWQSGAFVEQGAGSWIVWDEPSGAWASVVVRNDRPYPVTVSPVSQGPIVEVQVSPFDIDAAELDLDPERLDAATQLNLPPGAYAVVSMRVSDHCVPIGPGAGTGSDIALVKVTTFGVSENLAVAFPATYFAGSTSGHGADPACAEQ